MTNRNTIKINERELKSLIKESINCVLFESDDELSGVGNMASNTHYEIGFANQYYTLWEVSSDGVTTYYYYVQNISFDKDTALRKFPNAIFNENLRGKTKSFSTLEGPGRMVDVRSDNAGKSYATGDVIKDLYVYVTCEGHRKTKYGKYYRAIECRDIESFHSFVVPFFDGGYDERIPEGSVMHIISAVSSFYNAYSSELWLKDVEWEFAEGYNNDGFEHPIESGTKLVNKELYVDRYIGPHKIGSYMEDGLLLVLDEFKNVYNIKTSNNFRGNITYKFSDINFNTLVRGQKLLISGTVEIKDGVEFITRAKIVVTDEVKDEFSQDKVQSFYDNIDKNMQSMLKLTDDVMLTIERSSGKMNESQRYECSFQEALKYIEERYKNVLVGSTAYTYNASKGILPDDMPDMYDVWEILNKYHYLQRTRVKTYQIGGKSYGIYISVYPIKKYKGRKLTEEKHYTKQTIRINEGQLRQVIKESIKETLGL